MPLARPKIRSTPDGARDTARRWLVLEDNTTEEEPMPTVSKHTAATVNEYPVATDRFSDLEGYTASFVDIRETHSLAPMLASLPGGHCRCPHWGYLFQGRMVVHYDDHDEVVEQGQAFYMPPGHVPEADAGSEFVIFSPTAELKATEEAVMRAMSST
jgi:mannose-6-phosphate isomerase-like protein (cupin superfamily)